MNQNQGRPGVLVGIDVVEVARTRAAIDDLREVYLRRVCSPTERASIGPDTGPAVLAVAVKECLIKAIGGRAEPFDWHDLRVDLAAARPVHCGHNEAGTTAADVAGLVIAAAGPLRAALGIEAVFTAPCSVHAAALRVALLRLAGPAATATPAATAEAAGRVTGMALWGRSAGLLIAIAALTLATPDGSPYGATPPGTATEGDPDGTR